MLSPHSISAERAIIAAAVRGSQAIPAILASVDPLDFYIPRHQVLWDCARSLAGSGLRCDVLVISEELRRHGRLDEVGGDDWLMEVSDEYVSDIGLQGYAKIVRDHSISRSAITFAEKLAAEAQEGGSAIDLVQTAWRGISRLTDMAAGRTAGSGSIMATTGRILTNEKPKCLKTGLKFLDHYIQIRKTNQIVIGATPGAGKTSLMLAVACNVSLAEPVLINSLEMSEEELIENMMAITTNIPIDRISNRSLTPQEWATCRELMMAMEKNLRIVHCTTVAELQAEAMAMKNGDGLGLVAIDYLQLMEGPGDSRNDVIAKISRSTKLMAMSLDVPVILLSQLSREGAKAGRPALHHLRESGAIEQDANIVIFLWQDPTSMSPDTERMVTFAKNRRGAHGETMAGFDGSRTRFYDLVKR